MSSLIKQHPNFLLRINPWWPDDCSSFFNHVFKWLPILWQRPLSILEFGGGNSTLYFLAKGAKIVTVENNDRFVQFLNDTAISTGYRVEVINAEDFDESLFSTYDLIIIKAISLDQTANILTKAAWDLIVNDGISRAEIIQQVQDLSLNSIMLIDNVEFCANWGRLDRNSAKPKIIQSFRGILRDPAWQHYIFEQAEGRDGHSAADKFGFESPHRWIAAVLWPQNHIFAQLMVTQLGLPLVNEQGIQDADINSLEERCSYDPQTNRWNRERFPDELDLGLNRSYD